MLLLVGLLAVLAGGGALALPGLGARGHESASTVRPVADAHVSAAAPGRNYGRARGLVVASRPRTRAYLRFRVRGVQGSVRRARLRLFVLRGGGRLKVAPVRSNRWSERRITYRGAPVPGKATAFAPARRGRWSELDVTAIVPRSGLATLAVGISRGSVRLASREVRSRAPRLLVDSGTAVPVIAAAGNIACDPRSPSFNRGLGTANECRQRYTSDLLVGKGLAGVLTLGDAQYECGGYAAYLQAFHPTWGRVKPLLRPALGNHDYSHDPYWTDCDTSGAPSGYFRYFGAAAGNERRGYRSFDIGAWHLIALNSNCVQAGGCDTGSPQEAWLQRDLATHRNRCTLAFMHHPRFSSAYEEPGNLAVVPLWRTLYSGGVDVIVVAHHHFYERFAEQDPDGQRDERGPRQFVVGTGGVSHHEFRTTPRNSEVRNNVTFGVLLLTLRQAGYDWRFVPEAGASFTDSGSDSCR
jgi:calcineurin-like phosphoesterase family protein